VNKSLENVLREQAAYYQARASEYDQWFRRKGRYDRGPRLNQQRLEEDDEVARALDAFASPGRVLEFAVGTGLWTERLIRYAATVTVVDASSEMFALNRARVGESKTRFVTAEIFSWQPDASRIPVGTGTGTLTTGTEDAEKGMRCSIWTNRSPILSIQNISVFSVSVVSGSLVLAKGAG